MATFVWKGRTLGGEMQAGELDASRQEEAIELLRKRKILVTSLQTQGRWLPAAASSAAPA